MRSKPIATIAEELNNILTIVAMCTDELEAGPDRATLADLRDAVRRGAALTRLLCHQDEAALESGPAAVMDVVASRTTILVVEPEDVVRRSVATHTEGRGWRVLEATSIIDAMRALENVRSIDVIVVDTSFGGRRLASRLVERYPSAAVVFTGGYTDDAPLRSELPRTDVSLLSRPFTPTALVDRIAEAVSRRR